MKSATPLILFFFIALSGCAISLEQTGNAFATPSASEMRFSKDFDTVWDAAMKTLPDVPILRTDKAEGHIVGNWKNLKKSKRERLEIRLVKTGNETTVRIVSHVEVLIKNARIDTGFGTTVKTPMWKTVVSDTETPKQVFSKIRENLVEKPPEPAAETPALETKTPE